MLASNVVITFLSAIFPTVLGFVQGNILLEYFFLVLIYPSPIYSFVNRHLIVKMNLGILEGPNSPSYYELQQIISKSSLPMVVNMKTQIMVFVMSIIRLVLLAIVHLLRRLKKVHLESQTFLYKVKRSCKRVLSYSETLFYSSSMTIIGNFLYLRILVRFRSKQEFGSLLISLFNFFCMAQILMKSIEGSIRKYQKETRRRSSSKKVIAISKKFFILVSTLVTICSSIVIFAFFQNATVVTVFFVLASGSKIGFFLLMNFKVPLAFWKIMILAEVLFVGFFICQTVVEIKNTVPAVLLDALYLSGISIHFVGICLSVVSEILEAKFPEMFHLRLRASN